MHRTRFKIVWVVVVGVIVVRGGFWDAVLEMG